jgi:Skp family chaperone for outer membrane proteins
MKASIVFAMFTLVPGMFLMQSTGSPAVAVIDFDRAIANTPEGRDAISKINAFGNEQRTAIEAKIKEAEELQNRLRLQTSVLNDETRAQISSDLQSAETSIQTMQQNAQTRLAQMQQELLGPVEQKTIALVNTYAEERGMKLVFDSSALRNSLVYVHDTADITTEIMRRIASNVEKAGHANALLAPHEDLSTRLQKRLMGREWALNRDWQFD